ncbi:perilipin-1-like [Leptodactylus fuscus]|uniref:perilipin-1-like n=1 Tax=Leptodactylus fuscus TaxID=238119 RepID=UPI003F4EAE79
MAVQDLLLWKDLESHGHSGATCVIVDGPGWSHDYVFAGFVTVKGTADCSLQELYIISEEMSLREDTPTLLSFAYHDVKSLHPLVGYFCDISERGVQVVSGAAALVGSPLLKLVEPQVAVVNAAALRVVGELEDRLPVLDQPVDEVVSDVYSQVVSGVSEARVRAMGRAQDILDRTQTMLTDVYEAASLGVLSLGSLGARELVRLGVELVLNRAVDLVNVYLPEEHQEEGEATGPEVGVSQADDVEVADSGLFSRFGALLGTISTRGSSRLLSSLAPVWSFLPGALTLVSGIPSQLRQFSDAIMAALTTSKEGAKPKVTPKKKQPESSSGPAPTRRRLLNSPQRSLSIFRVFSHDRRVLGDTGRGRVRGLVRRCQSVDGAFYPSQIQED